MSDKLTTVSEKSCVVPEQVNREQRAANKSSYEALIEAKQKLAEIESQIRYENLKNSKVQERQITAKYDLSKYIPSLDVEIIHAFPTENVAALLSSSSKIGQKRNMSEFIHDQQSTHNNIHCQPFKKYKTLDMNVFTDNNQNRLAFDQQMNHSQTETIDELPEQLKENISEMKANEDHSRKSVKDAWFLIKDEQKRKQLRSGKWKKGFSFEIQSTSDLRERVNVLQMTNNSIFMQSKYIPICSCIDCYHSYYNLQSKKMRSIYKQNKKNNNEAFFIERKKLKVEKKIRKRKLDKMKSKKMRKRLKMKHNIL